MSKDKIKGGKADKMSITDIAKKHDVSAESIEAQIEIGKKIEMEHVDDESLAKEIAMDHLDEIPDYYTRLNKMEKEAKKELSLEARKFMSLSGIKEDDKKFLTNESFSEDSINPGNWKGMDSMPTATPNQDAWKELDGAFMGPNAISQDKLDAVSKMMEDSHEEKDSDFIIMEFDQIDVEPGEDDETLYKID